MKFGSTMLLRVTIVLLGLIVAAICLLVLPRLILSELRGDFDYGWIFVGMYVTAVPFFLALYQAMKLLNNIDHNKAFSIASVDALGMIKYCGYAISGMYLAGMPYIFYAAQKDDAPGVALIGFIIIGASFIVGVSASVFEKLFLNGVTIKSENDELV